MKAAFCFLADVQNLFSSLRAGSRNCIDNMVHFIFLNHFQYVIPVPDNRNPFQYPASFVRIVVNHTAHLCVEAAAVNQFLDQNLSCLSASDNHNPVLLIFSFILPLPICIRAKQTVGKSCSCRHAEAKHIPHKIIGTRHAKMHK